MRLSLALLLLAALPAGARAEGPVARAAVIVGANKAAAGRSALRYSHEDARDLARALERVGGFEEHEVELLFDPEPDELLAALDRRMDELGRSGRESLLVFYYSGHSDSQALYPNGRALSLSRLRERLDSPRATVRVGIIDACRGGGWTQAKGLHSEKPFEVGAPMDLGAEGSVLLASSSGTENAHESSAIRGSFFTHHLVAGLLGAADQSGEGEITVGEAFAYAKELTIRDSTLHADAPQHPSFAMNLHGRSDLPLARLAASGTLVDLKQSSGPLQLVDLSRGLIVLELPAGKRAMRAAVPPGRYLVRRRQLERTWAREIVVEAGAVTEVSEESLQVVGGPSLNTKDGSALSPVMYSTLPADTMALRARWGMTRGINRGTARLAFSWWDAELDFQWGLTDRLQTSLPWPSLAYRFGDRGGFETIPWASLFLSASEKACAEQQQSCTPLDYGAIGGIDARWWLRGYHSLLFSVAATAVKSLAQDPSTRGTVASTIGYSYDVTSRMTLNLGVQLGYQLGAPDVVVSLGSVLTLGMRPLPLVQFRLTEFLTLDGFIALEDALSEKSSGGSWAIGMSWTF